MMNFLKGILKFLVIGAAALLVANWVGWSEQSVADRFKKIADRISNEVKASESFKTLKTKTQRWIDTVKAKGKTTEPQKVVTEKVEAAKTAVQAVKDKTKDATKEAIEKVTKATDETTVGRASPVRAQKESGRESDQISPTEKEKLKLLILELNGSK